MHTVVLEGGAAPKLVDRPRPEPGPGEALVRVERVGIDGTDHEVIEGTHGSVDGEMVVGHEAVGVVVESNETDFGTGETVVPTVRRPPGASNGYFRRGEPDMAPPEATYECGIDGADGFMAEYITVPEQFLVPLPDDLRPYGFLAEPLSVTAKALELAYDSRASFAYDRERALVLGTGSLGLLTLPVLADDFEEVYCLGRRDTDDPAVELARELGATYIDSRETPLDTVADTYAPMDLVYEATGHAPHAVDAVTALAQNGVAALLGVPGEYAGEVELGRLHRELVVGNRAVVGSVNAGYAHFEQAVEWLGDLPAPLLDAYTENVVPVAEFSAAFDRDVIKTAVQFHP